MDYAGNFEFISTVDIDDKVKPSLLGTYEDMKMARARLTQKSADPVIQCRRCQKKILFSKSVLARVSERDKKKRRVCVRCGGVCYEVE